MLRAQAALWLDWLLFKHINMNAPPGIMQSPEVCENRLKKAP